MKRLSETFAVFILPISLLAACGIDSGSLGCPQNYTGNYPHCVADGSPSASNTSTGTGTGTAISTVTVSGVIDTTASNKPALGGGGTIHSPVSAGIHVKAYDKNGAEAGSATTDTNGAFLLSLSKNATYALRIAYGNVVMKAVVAVGSSATTANVNPRSTAIAIALGKKIGVANLGDSGVSFSTQIATTDVGQSITVIAANPNFSALVTSVQSSVTAGTNPFNDSAIATAATAIASGTSTGAGTGTTTTISANLMGGAIQRQLTLTGTIMTFAGKAGPWGGFSSDGIGAAAHFNGPAGITTDGTNLYVIDNDTIRKVVIATGVVTTLAGHLVVGGSSSDGIGEVAGFYSPSGITTDGTNLYVADTVNNTIRKVVIATGAVTTLAGNASWGAAAHDGIGVAAHFNYPWGITTDNTNLYVTDRNNHTIRKVVEYFPI